MKQKQKKLMSLQLGSIIVVLFFCVSNFATSQKTKAQQTASATGNAMNRINNSNHAQQGSQIVDGQIIIKYRKDKINLKNATGRSRATKLKKDQQVQKIDGISDSNIEVVTTTQPFDEKITQLQNDPNIEIAQPNFKKFPTATTNDPKFLDLTDPQWYLKKIKIPEAWDLEASGDVWDTTVAVIDNGAYYNHEDLIGNMWNPVAICFTETGTMIPAGCPNHGWYYKFDGTNSNDPMAEPDIDPVTSIDSGMHGTRVSGIIGAVTNNSLGVSSISRNNNLKVMAVRFGFDSFSEVKAINFAEQNGARVINASYAGPDFDPLEKNAICNFSGIFVAAAGNETANNDTTPSYPANQDCPNIISVAATDKNDALSTFSNYGATSVDIAAPGQSIATIYFDSNTSYVSGVAGTSISTPMVSGAVALIANKFPAMTNAQLKNIILASGDTLPSPTDAAKILSGKRLNVQAALVLAIGDITSPASPSSLLVQ